MLTLGSEDLDRLESQHPGIAESIRRFEAADLPPCPKCKSSETASVQVGIVGRSIAIASATTKFHLRPNGRPGNYFCSSCGQYFA